MRSVRSTLKTAERSVVALLPPVTMTGTDCPARRTRATAPDLPEAGFEREVGGDAGAPVHVDLHVPGRGSTFTVDLPRLVASPDPLPV
jgi:hypothetical protein